LKVRLSWAAFFAFRFEKTGVSHEHNYLQQFVHNYHE
jgi:hypothetical protein